MDMLPCLLACYPSGGTGHGGNAAVGSHSIFKCHIGLSCSDVMKEDGIKSIALFLKEASFHLESMFPQYFYTFSCSQRIGVGRADYNTLHSRFYQGFCTWGLLAGVAAGLKGNIDIGPFGVLSPPDAVSQCLPLCMETAILCVIPFAYEAAILYYDSTHKRIGTCLSLSFCSQLYGPSHILFFWHKKTPDPGLMVKKIFSHPDYTVGYGIAPYHALKKGSLAYAHGAHSR